MSSVLFSSDIFHEIYNVWPIDVAHWFAASNVSVFYLPVEIFDFLISVLWAFPLIIRPASKLIINHSNLLNWYRLVLLLYLSEQITQILITIFRCILSLW